LFGVDQPSQPDGAGNLLLRRIFNAMQLHSFRTFQKGTVPYSSEAMRQDLETVRDVWKDCQATRDRNAIYAYLSAVYRLVAWWAAEGREVDRARRALRLQRLEVSHREDPFGAVIRCTADPAKAEKRTRSKWSRVLRYVAVTRLCDGQYATVLQLPAVSRGTDASEREKTAGVIGQTMTFNMDATH
jgi:hypothetical protein